MWMIISASFPSLLEYIMQINELLSNSTDLKWSMAICGQRNVDSGNNWEVFQPNKK